MRKILGLLGLTAIAFYAWAQSGAGQLSSYAKALNSATSLSANYTLQRVGGTKDEYNVQLAKPNMARVETSGWIVVADGKTVTTYDKAAKTYSKRPQAEGELKGLL